LFVTGNIGSLRFYVQSLQELQNCGSPNCAYLPTWPCYAKLSSAAAAAAAAAAGCLVQRRRKNRKVVEPKVKVQSAVVDMATGKTPASTAGEAETRVVQVLGSFFFVLLTEGLLLAGSVSGWWVQLPAVAVVLNWPTARG
jgi:hypothetical protein